MRFWWLLWINIILSTLRYLEPGVQLQDPQINHWFLPNEYASICISLILELWDSKIRLNTGRPTKILSRSASTYDQPRFLPNIPWLPFLAGGTWYGSNHKLYGWFWTTGSIVVIVNTFYAAYSSIIEIASRFISWCYLLCEPWKQEAWWCRNAWTIEHEYYPGTWKSLPRESNQTLFRCRGWDYKVSGKK